MKYKLFILIFFLFITTTMFSQIMGKASKRGNKVGKKFFNDLIFAIDPGVARMDNNNTFIVGGYISWLFNNNMYLGINYENKIGITNNTVTKRNKNDKGNLHYNNPGINYGKYFPLKKKNVSALRIKTRLNVSLRVGVGSLSINDSITNKPFYNRYTKDHLFTVVPAVGFERTISKFFAIGFGANYRFLFRNDFYYEKSKDISGPGIYFALRFSLFNNNWAKNSSPRF